MNTDDKRNFDAAASTWDEEPRRRKLAADVGGAIRSAVPISRDLEVLDLGCGTGLVTLDLAPLVKEIAAADASTGMLAALEEKARARGLSNVRPVRLDLDGAFSLAGPYDLVVSSMALHHVRDVDALLPRILSSLRPGGWAALADLEPEGGAFHDDNAGVFHFGFDPAAFARRLERVGFVDVKVRRAATMVKERDGAPREFHVFLAAARRA